MLVHVNAEIRDVSLKTMGHAPSAVIGTHSTPQRVIKPIVIAKRA
jgi:hypothetical protein